ncbi:MAG: glycosyltransferase [Candidatus Omnitrophica bacterium]|nr:glycosyltransferase [Candidatus Omnitrophota bacterium]
MNVFVIVPVYNEKEVLAGTIDQLMACGSDVERILIVNDGSTDGTAQLADRLAGKFPDMVSVINSAHEGFAQAIRTGISAVPEGAAFVVVMADACDDLTQIRKMCALIIDADVVVASRYVPGGRRQGGDWLKAAGSRAVNLFFAALLRGRCHDATNSFKMYRKLILRDVVLTSRGFEISMEMTVKAFRRGARFVEIPTQWIERRQGTSKFHLLRHGWRYVLGVLMFAGQHDKDGHGGAGPATR